MTDNCDPNILKNPDIGFEPHGCLGVQLFRAMQKHSELTAQILSSTGERDTYDSLLKRSIRTALKMRSMGLNRDDLVVICSYNHLNSCVPFLSATFLGLKVACLDPTQSLTDTAHLLKQIKPAIIFVVPEAIDLIRTALRRAEIETDLVVFGESLLEPVLGEEDFQPIQVDLRETAVILFSSGTTGMPKGICHSGYTILRRSPSMYLGVNLTYSTLYWISSLILFTGSILTGSTRVICQSFEPEDVWELIEKFKINGIFLAPNQALDIVQTTGSQTKTRSDISSLVTVCIGGGSISKQTLIELKNLLPSTTTIYRNYGQTEIAGAATFIRHDPNNFDYKLDSCGWLVEGFWAKVVDLETGKVLGPNQPGELRFKTPFMMTGYYNLDSSEAFDSDGWLRTGDIVYYDQDRYFFVVDRLKEMIKYRGWHLVPGVLENVLLNHPAVRNVCVIGLPYDDHGEHAMALVQLHSDQEASEQELLEFTHSRVMDRERLRGGIKFIDKFEMTPSGKIKRYEMRQKVLKGEI